jgi:nucleotide-binding universal stress UspA family protein
MTRLLCATDLLPKSEAAIDRAALMAHELGADLSLLHVVSPVTSERALEHSLQTAIARMKSRARPPLWRGRALPNVIVRAGNPGRVIADTIAGEQPDLFIIGPHRKRGMLEALQGTIAEKTVSARRCPVLIVQERASSPYRNVLLALDGADASRRAVRVAERLVLRDAARTTVIHACASLRHGVLQAAGGEAPAVTFATDCSPGEAAATMRELLARESAEPARYELDVVDGTALPTIERAIARLQPDLLVMGTRGEGRMRRAVFGSVANQLLRIAPCDTLIVPLPIGAGHG